MYLNVLVAFLSSFVLVSCATWNSSPGYSFPHAFIATQIIEIESEKGATKFLGQIQSTEPMTKVILLEPALSLPVLSMQQGHDGFKRHWYKSMDENFDFSKQIIDTIRYIYNRKEAYQILKKHSIADGWFVLEGLKKTDNCIFPENIKISFGKNLTIIKIKTVNLQCE